MKHPLMLDPRGRKPGGDTPRICTPLVCRTRERLLAEVAGILPKSPDLLEWRVDHFGAIADTAAVIETLHELRRAAGELPIIFTCRARKEGGYRIPLGEAQIVELHEAVAETRLVEFIDFESDNDPGLVRRVRQSTQAQEVRLILSYHNISYTPRGRAAGRRRGAVACQAPRPCRCAAPSCGHGRSRHQGTHPADQHVDGATGVGVAHGRRPVRLEPFVRRR
jgi:Type I 3-dehydroquinase